MGVAPGSGVMTWPPWEKKITKVLDYWNGPSPMPGIKCQWHLDGCIFPRTTISVYLRQFSRFLAWIFFHKYRLRCHLISRLFRLDFMRQVGSYSNHEHSVIPHARSTCAVDRFASLSQFMPICSKHLKPLGLILAMKTSEIWLEMWLLLLGNKYYNSFECTQLTPSFNFV